MKRICGLYVLCLLALTSASCQKNFNHYRELIYGKWELVSENDRVPKNPDRLFFKTSTAVTLSHEGVDYEGQYQFYCNVLTTRFEKKQDLFQEWRVETLQDSLMIAVVELCTTTEGEQEPGAVLEFRKLP
ncbi:MAG: hypothetical protein GX877_05165 [Bacteroidales bacterium]|nr:hypothetical protein [Bacteroidales bacterium]